MKTALFSHKAVEALSPEDEHSRYVLQELTRPFFLLRDLNRVPNPGGHQTPLIPSAYPPLNLGGALTSVAGGGDARVTVGPGQQQRWRGSRMRRPVPRWGEGT